jgi:Na+/proline symporter
VHYLSIDHIVVYVFLLVTLVVGLLAGRAIKDIEEYAIANRVYGTGVLTITFLATFIGGSTIIGTTGNVFRDGILPIIATGVAPMICILWMAVWIAPRIIHFEGSLTMGDIMGTLYGRHGQVATGVLGFLFTICAVSAQIVALAYVYEFLLGFKSYWAIGLGGLIAVTYASMGGMKAVTTTDVLQFAVLVIVIPMIANVMTHEVGGIKELLSKVPAEKLQIAGHAKIGYYTSLALFLGVLSPFLLSPPFVAHMLMAREKKQATHMLFIGGAFLLFFFFLIMLIGLAAFVLYPSISPDKIIPHVVIELFPVGLRGVCAAGIIAVIMSTADSCLHTSGLSLIHDVIRPLSTAKIQELRWVKYCTFAIGCVSILMTRVTHSIFGMMIYGMGMMGTVITVPFVAGVLGLKTDPKSFKIALWVTIPVFIATNLQFSAEIHHWAYPVSLIVNVLTFFGTHVLQNKGFMLEKRMSVGNQRLLWRPTWSGWARWLPTPRKLLAYSHQKVSQYGTDSTLFALFLSLNHMVPFFMYSYSNPSIYGWILAIKSISIFLCLGLLLKPYWPPRLLAYFPAYYHLTLLYCLPFTSTVMFLLTQGSVDWLTNVALTIMFLIVLADWMSFIILTVLGVALGFLFHKLSIGPIDLHLDFSTGYLLVYTCLFSTLIALLFARRKEQHFAAKLREIQEQQYAVQQGDFPHPATERIATMIDRQVQEFLLVHKQKTTYNTETRQQDEPNTVPDCLHYFFPTTLAVFKQGTHINKHLIEVMTEEYIAPHLALSSLQACMATIVTAYAAGYQQEIDVDLSEDYPIYTSFNHLQYAIVHVLQFLHAHHLEEQVRLWIARQEGVHIRLSGQAVSSSLVQELFSLFPLKEKTQNMGLAISRLLIEAHGGHLLCKTCSIPSQAYTEFVLVIPPAEMEAEVNAEPT